MTSDFRPWVKTIVIVSITLFVFVAVYPFVAICFSRYSAEELTPWKSILEQCSSYGGMFNVIAAMFSGFGFVVICITLCVGQDQLELTRTQLQLTRNELDAAKADRERDAEAARDARMQAALAAKREQQLRLNTASSPLTNRCFSTKGSLQSSTSGTTKGVGMRGAEETQKHIEQLLKSFELNGSR